MISKETADIHHYVERWTSRVLRAGVWTSAVLMGAGLLLAAGRSFGDGVSPRSPSLTELFHNLAVSPLDPATLMFTGLVVLMLTPILRVMTAMTGFIAEKDRRFVAVAALVLLMLLGEVVYSMLIT
jgi:uncharacterized membrane protein